MYVYQFRCWRCRQWYETDAQDDVAANVLLKANGWRMVRGQDGKRHAVCPKCAPKRGGEE